MIQALRLVTGLLLINFLPIEEFAHYALAYAAFTVFALISDGGVSSALLSLGSGVKQEPGRLRTLIDDVFGVRARLGLAALAVGLPVLAWIMVRLDFGAGLIIATLALAVINLAVSLWCAVWSTVLRLDGAYRRLQMIDLASSLFRVGTIGAALALTRSGLALLAVSVGVQGVTVLLLRSRARASRAVAPTGASFRPQVTSVLRAAMPGVVFYALQGQVTIAVLALLGTQSAIAGAGALTRIAVVFVVLDPLVTNVLAPRFASVAEDESFRRYFQGVLGAAVTAAAILSLVAVFRRPILSLLGSAYSGLELELLIVTGAAGLAFVRDVAGHLNKARAWVRRSWFSAPAVLGAQLVALTLVDVSTLQGALWLGAVGAGAALVVLLYQATLSSAYLPIKARGV
jgi:O-antigen/teichoic acid export membrane protein